MKNAFKKNKTEIKTLFVWEKRFSKETISVFGKNVFGRNDIEIKTPQASRGAVSDKFTNSYEENLKTLSKTLRASHFIY